MLQLNNIRQYHDVRLRMRQFIFLLLLVLGGFLSIVTLTHVIPKNSQESSAAPTSSYDPLALARASIGKTENFEAVVPSQCYTKTDGIANPCWTCHTQSQGENFQRDWHLQETYSFSDFALTNRWNNLFVDRSAAIAALSDTETLTYIRADNYTPLRTALKGQTDYPGYVPDLDFSQGFDDEGFAKDGSGWRALRYKPFLGTFWPTNGSTDDVMIRLPRSFQTDSQGNFSREIYKLNLALLEAAMTVAPSIPAKEFSRVVEPVNEHLAATDLDGNGHLASDATRIHQLPPYYRGGASTVPISRYRYPEGTEFLHTVRYIDPDNPTLLSTRMKEVRYSRKMQWLDDWALMRVYEKELLDKEEGKLPTFKGSPLVGLRNDFGWQLQGFIEDAQGRLRLQTEEEQRFCMGCHSAIGVTVDQTFAFARKVPGAEGWRPQDLRGIRDVPQAGHADPEILTYFQRVTGGDEFRANDEIRQRFFSSGSLDEPTVRRAALNGDQDITFLIAPSPQRALQLNKAYIALVREQTFEKGRDTLLVPPQNVHATIENGSTELATKERIYFDGQLWLDWSR